MFSTVVMPVLLFGFLVLIHELGHFLVAKYAGVYVERFAIGMGPALFKKTWGETEYALCALPLGGYVKMAGEDESEESKTNPRSLTAQSVWTRIAIVAMGPIVNLVFPIFLFALLFFKGVPVAQSKIGHVLNGSPAQKAGLLSGDQIVAIDGESVETWEDILSSVRLAGGSAIAMGVKRGTQTFDVKIQPENVERMNRYGEIEKTSVIGVSVEPLRPVIGVVDTASAAAIEGLKTGDVITAINGVPINHFWQVDRFFAKRRRLESLSFDRVQEMTKKGFDYKSRTLIFDPPLTASMAEFGIESGNLYLRKVLEGSVADEVGLKAGDRLLALGGQPIASFGAFKDAIESGQNDSALELSILRDGEQMTFNLTPKIVSTEDAVTQKKIKKRQLGIQSASIPVAPAMTIQKYRNPLQALKKGFSETWDIAKTTLKGFGHLIMGKLPLTTMGGPFSIFYLAGSSYRAGGLMAFFKIMAILSITLGVLNLLPIPVLDGGHLFFYAIEVVKGSPVNEKARIVAQNIGIAMLVGIMILVFYVDIKRFFVGPIKDFLFG